ncbi:IclR family transcriptional regulator [Bosea sp. PAMC 26642]|uniref:IclR family transcriptional regulator n=1 Tax=Bosea sp. (strain PAMC 26642) TaxID=1792307 RepID=UPI0007703E6F|nr:IclR family transcriptional regulator [Bosea sp. PAMC 26642]AMJ63233.1 hypothetical protein AXW83_25640 [Bosea sp. PAMC 26642]
MVVKNRSSHEEGRGDMASEPGSDAKALGVASVQRALNILTAFQVNDSGLTLAELSRRTGYYKSTLLRLLATLQDHRFVSKLPDGRYTLGSIVFYLGQVYDQSLNLRAVIEPVLKDLAKETDEDAMFEIRENDSRLVLLRSDGQQRVREHVMVGTLLPLDVGAPGHVLTRFANGPGRHTGEDLIIDSFGERDPEIAGVAAPVFGPGSRLIGSLCVTGTITRFHNKEHLRAIRAAVMRAARQLTSSLGGEARSIFP